MELEKIQKILSAKRRGTYVTLTYKKGENGFEKTTTTTIRLCDYYSVIHQERPTKKGEKESNDIYLGNNIVYNEHTKKTRLMVFLTNNPKHKGKSIYEYQGVEIEKEQYYDNVKQKPSNPKIMFSININDIVSIKA